MAAAIDLVSSRCMFLPSDLVGLAPTGTLPLVTSSSPPEPYVAYEAPSDCDPEPKPGLATFRAFVLSHLGGGDSGICRECKGSASSEHNEGRAWDWTVNTSNSADVERVAKLFDWLFAPDYGVPNANFRRLGLMYVIWNNAIWSTKTKDWRPYTGKSAHTDHVHFSFGWDGALGKTSFFRWLRGGEPDVPRIPDAQPGGSSRRQTSLWPAIAGFVVGATAVIAVKKRASS